MLELITIYVDCLKINPDYFYPDAKITKEIVKTTQDLFRYDEALLILNKFTKNYPNSDQIPYAFFIAAQILVDYKQQDE